VKQEACQSNLVSTRVCFPFESHSRVKTKRGFYTIICAGWSLFPACGQFAVY